MKGKALEIRSDRCSRAACRAEIDVEYHGTHKDTGLCYCLACGRMINRVCGQELVTWPKPKKRIQT